MVSCKPLFSIITPTLNGGKYIKKAIESVLNQNFSSYEHLIIDSNSRDKTKLIIKDFPSVTHIVEKDESSHHAINKGIRLSKGNIICFLNSDDWLEPGILKKIRDIFLKDKNKNMIYNCRYKLYSNNKYLHTYKGLQNLSEEFMFGAPGFNSFFFDRSVFQKGLLNTNFNFSADREFLLRSTLSFEFKQLEFVAYNYRCHDGSRTLSGNNSNKISLEHIRIYKKIKTKFKKNLSTTWFLVEIIRLIKKKKKKK